MFTYEEICYLQVQRSVLEPLVPANNQIAGIHRIPPAQEKLKQNKTNDMFNVAQSRIIFIFICIKILLFLNRILKPGTISSTSALSLGLLTECEACTGKHLPDVFVQTERRRNRGLCRKTEGKYFPVQTEQTRFIRHLLRLFGSFSSLFLRLCQSSDVAAYLTSKLVVFASCFRFMFTPVRHSFASLINKKLLRNATMMFQGVLLPSPILYYLLYCLLLYYAIYCIAFSYTILYYLLYCLLLYYAIQCIAFSQQYASAI